MLAFDEIKEYIATVCEQIRWEKAKPIIAIEIENHICDQRDAYISEGDDESEATSKALLQMGDAVLVGQELDKTHKPKPQWTMITLVGIFMTIGGLINYFIMNSVDELNMFKIFPYILAFGIFIICYFIDFSILGKYSLHFYFFILTSTLIPAIFSKTYKTIFMSEFDNYIHSTHIGFFHINTAYFSLIYPLAFALLVYSMRNKGYRGIILSSVGFIPLAIILFKASASVGFVLYALSSLVILCIAIAKGWFGVKKMYGLLLVLIPAFIALAFSFLILILYPYHMQRLIVFLTPYEYKKEAGFVYCVIRDFLKEAVFIGKGGIPYENGFIFNFPHAFTD